MIMTAKVPTAMVVRVIAFAVLAAATTISLMVVCAMIYAYMDDIAECVEGCLRYLASWRATCSKCARRLKFSFHQASATRSHDARLQSEAKK